jgi:hypothetical protein
MSANRPAVGRQPGTQVLVLDYPQPRLSLIGAETIALLAPAKITRSTRHKEKFTAEGVACLVVLGIAAVRLNLRLSRKYQRQIDDLDALPKNS